MRISQLYGITALAGIAFATVGGLAIAQQQTEGWSLKDETGEALGDLYVETSDQQRVVYSSDQLQARFYVQMHEDGRPVNEGYYVRYNSPDDQCQEGPAQDHLGKNVESWGYLEAHRAPDSESFTLILGICNGPLEEKLFAVY